MKPLNKKQAEFVREAHKIMDAHTLGAEMDAGFDAGEWSGPAHDEAERAELEVLADNYDLSADEAHDLLNPIFCEECGDSGCPSCFEDDGIQLVDGQLVNIHCGRPEPADGQAILDWHMKMGNIYTVDEDTLNRPEFMPKFEGLVAMAADGVEVDFCMKPEILPLYLVDHPMPEDW